MPFTAPLREFLASVDSEYVEIATADLRQLVEAAERSAPTSRARVPSIAVAAAVAAIGAAA